MEKAKHKEENEKLMDKNFKLARLTRDFNLPEVNDDHILHLFAILINCDLIPQTSSELKLETCVFLSSISLCFLLSGCSQKDCFLLVFDHCQERGQVSVQQNP